MDRTVKALLFSIAVAVWALVLTSHQPIHAQTTLQNQLAFTQMANDVHRILQQVMDGDPKTPTIAAQIDHLTTTMNSIVSGNQSVKCSDQ